MKRYILMLALISMQAGIILPNNIWERLKANVKSNFQSKMNSMFGYLKFKTAQAQEPENKTVPAKIEPKLPNLELGRKDMVTDHIVGDTLTDRFETTVDWLVDERNLNPDQRNDLSLVKGVCGNYVRLLHERLPFLSRKILIDQGGHCIADFAGFQKQNDCNELWFNELWLEERQEAYDKYKSEVFGCLAYLFNSPVREYVIEKTAKMSKRRLKSWINPNPLFFPDKMNIVIIPSSEAEYRSKR